MKYINILEAPISITGLAAAEGDMFSRLPLDMHDKVNDAVSDLSKCTAGACVRFAASSKTAAVRVTLLNTGGMNEMPMKNR